MGFEPRQHHSHLESINEFKDWMKEALDKAKVALTKSKDNMARYYVQRQTLAPNYQPGDKVYPNMSDIQTTQPSKELSHCCLGPFGIVKKVGNGTYCLKLSCSMSCLHLLFDVVRLTPALPDSILGHHLRPLPPLEIIDREEEWIEEEILDSKVINWKLQYLIKWEGFRIEHNSWEPWDDIHTLDLIAEFYWKHPGTACQVRAIDFSAILFCVVLGCHFLEGGGEWMSEDTHFLWHLHHLFLLPLCYLLFHPPVLSLNNINNHLWISLPISEHCIEFPFTFLLFFPLFFSLLFWYLHQMDFDRLQDGLYQQPLCLFLSSLLSSFLSSFPMLPCLTFYFWGLNFPFTYSHRLPPSRSLSFSPKISC